MDFTGKVALVTGGGGGIGIATCLGFARRGAKVVVVDYDAAIGQAAASQVKAAGGEAIFVRADVSKSADVQGYVKAAMEAYGRIDCFFNNAGIEGKVTPITDYEEETWNAVIGVNLTGVFLGLKYVLPVMLKQESGTVVNTASTAALFGAPGMAAYVASKHGVAGLTKVASSDVARYGVRVNAIAPGYVRTPLMAKLEQEGKVDTSAISRRAPLGRLGTPEEMAEAIWFLASPAASYISGVVLNVDGGWQAFGMAGDAPPVE